MSKTIRIIIYLAIMLFIFIWLSRSINGCSPRQHMDPIVEGQVDGNEEDLFEDGEATAENDESEEGLFESDEEPIDYTALDEAIEKSFEKKTDDTEFESETSTETADNNAYDSYQESTTTTYASSYGDYLVIAGNFLVSDNASRMVTKRQNMGHSSAEKLTFDASEYHSVIAGRFSDYGDAIDVSNSLKNKGIDCYVQKKRY